MNQHLRAAIQMADTFRTSIDGWSVGVTQTTLDNEGDPLMVVMDVPRSKWVADAVFSKPDLEPCDFASFGGPFPIAYSDGLALFDPAAAPCQVGALPVPTFDPSQNVLPFMATIAMHYLAIGQIPALKSSWISKVWANLTIAEFERKETYYDTRDIPNSYFDQTIETIDDLSLGLFSIAYEDETVTAVNLLQTVDLSGVVRLPGAVSGYDLKGTVDITGLMTFLAENLPPANTIYALGVIGAGTGDLGNGWKAIAQKWILNFEGEVNSAGSGWDYYAFKTQRIEFSSVGIGNVFVTLDMPTIEDEGLECPPDFFPPMD